MRKRTGTCRALCLAAAAAWFLSAAYGQASFRYFYDGNGQLFRVLDSSGNLVEYDYDASGNPTQIRRSPVAPASVAILNIVPQRGGSNSTVTIYGQNFSSVATGDTVMFNGIAATVVSASSTALVVQAPNAVTTGPVSVTENGVTVTSGTLNFTVPNLPTITSISPAAGYDGQTVTVNVQGTNLTDANFAFVGAGGIGVSNVSVTSATQASFTANIGQVGGNFVLVATNDFGSSTSLTTPGNLFRVYLPPGDNYISVRLAVFNTYLATGNQPGVPPGTSAATETLSVFNAYLATGNQPGVPPGTSAATETLSVFNAYLATGNQPGVPPGTSAATETLSVFNKYLAPGSQPGVPVGSRTAFEMFSAGNAAAGVQSLPTLAIAPSLRSAAASSAASGISGAVSTLGAGQTVGIDVGAAAGFLPELQFRVNGIVLASSQNGSLKTWFTVPYGMKSLTLDATGQSPYGQAVTSLPSQIAVTPDSTVTLAGRAMDGEGRPLPGAPLTWQANGLTADYYRFSQALAGIPDLTGLQPARTGYVSALNFPNPQDVFGQDPMGVGLGQNYAVRFHGALSIATAGSYRFQLNAQSGASLQIDGEIVTDTAGALAAATLAGTTLAAGEHDIAVVYYQSGAASSAVQLLWTPPGGVQSAVPPSVLTTSASVTAATTAGADGSFRLSVPASLTGVRVTVVNGQGSVVLDQ